MAQSSLIFITGGVRSGKSGFAEKLAISLSVKNNVPLYYIACGNPSDREMGERIARHKRDRKNSHEKWATLEYPVAIERAVPVLKPNCIVVLDCLTTLLNNEMFPSMEQIDEWRSPAFLDSVKGSIIKGIEEIRERASCLILVSNEVLHAPIQAKGVNMAYSKMIGRLHQEIVSMSEEAYLLEAGCALLMKGEQG